MAKMATDLWWPSEDEGHVFASWDMGLVSASNLKNLKTEIQGPCLAQNHPVPLFPRGENAFLLASTTIFLDLEKLVL